jgi:hypothetical protein
MSSPHMHPEGSLSLSWSEATCVGKSYPDEPVGSPSSAWGHFSRRPPAEDPIYRGTVSLCREGEVHRGDGGGKAAPRSTSPSLEDANLEEASVPHPFTARRAVRRSLSLSSRAHISSLEACLTSCPTASAGGLTSSGSPQPPPRPYARS